MTTQPLNFPAGADAVTVGPDGNLWLVASQQNMVGRLTQDGAFTPFPIPTQNAQPLSITVGSDGNL